MVFALKPLHISCDQIVQIVDISVIHQVQRLVVHQLDAFSPAELSNIDCYMLKPLHLPMLGCLAEPLDTGVPHGYRRDPAP